MSFSQITGHGSIIENLRKMVDSGRMPHAVLFVEKEGYGALPLALSTLEYMFCKEKRDGDSCGKCSNCIKIRKLVHPDIHFTFPINVSSTIGGDKRGEVEQFYPAWRELIKENPYFGEQELYRTMGMENKLGTISVAEANSIIRKLSLSSYEGGDRIMLIMFPERMNQEAANKLLKNLEEPGNGTYYFLISHNPGKIISTILSRCRIVELAPIDAGLLIQELQNRFALDTEEASFWAKCSGGSIGKAIELIQKENGDDEKTGIFISILENALNKDLASLMDIWEQIASCGKEVQKGICLEGLDILRKLYMLSLGLDSIAYSPSSEMAKFKTLQERIKGDFYMKGYGWLNNALECIERNVNPKFIFCDLCNRIFYNI